MAVPAGGAALAFTGGGTGGHIYPGLAVIGELRARGFPGRIVWIGSAKDSDRAAVEACGHGVEYRAIPSGKLRRSLSAENVADAFRVLAGYLAARRILRELAPAFLFSKGGYVSVPPCRAAAALRIPYATHESDASPGLATRLNAGRAEVVFTSWPSTAGYFTQGLRAKVRAVGNPVRASIRSGDARAGRAFLGVPEGLPVVLFLGGSQGARQVNELAAAVLPALAGKAFVAHQTGRGNEGAVSAAAVSGGGAGHGAGAYRGFAYLEGEMPDVMAAADIVVGRSGAGTVWESAALGKPMILVPLAGAGTRGDQVENARLAEDAGAAVALVGPDATPEKLTQAILRWLEDGDARAAAAAAAGRLARGTAEDGGDAGTSDAAARIADYILARTGGGA